MSLDQVRLNAVISLEDIKNCISYAQAIQILCHELDFIKSNFHNGWNRCVEKTFNALFSDDADKAIIYKMLHAKIKERAYQEMEENPNIAVQHAAGFFRQIPRTIIPLQAFENNELVEFGLSRSELETFLSTVNKIVQMCDSVAESDE
jgi:hypothetical protein